MTDAVTDPPEPEVPILRVGGVPEHFNLPWHLAQAADEFHRAGVDIDWHDQPSGTGQMMRGLTEGDLDVAVALTEGIVTAISNGTPARVVALYTSSPLQWGVHVPGSSGVTELGGLGPGDRFAISRFGSGSHLMAHVLADRLGYGLTEENFVVVGTIDGARETLGAGEAEVFLWDRFMTSPLVESGDFARVGVQPTPWPAFAIAATLDCLESSADALRAALSTIAVAGERFGRQPADEVADLVVDRHGLARDVALDWFADTDWAEAGPVDPGMIASVQDRLASLDLVTEPRDPAHYLAEV